MRMVSLVYQRKRIYMSLFSSIASIFTGFVRKGFKIFKTGDWIENAVKSYSPLLKYVPMVGTLIGSLFNGKAGYASNYLNGVTGAGLTNAQIQQNDFVMSQQLAQQQYNAAEAQKNREFQERMSNTAYQRGTADMIAAGLNPAMMYGGSGASASTPSGSAASSAAPAGSSPSNVYGGLLDTLLNVAFANERLRGLQLDNEGKEITNELSTIDLNNRQEVIDLQKRSLALSNENVAASTRNLEQAVKTGAADEALKRAGIEKTEAEAALSWLSAVWQNKQNEYFDQVKEYRALLERLTVAEKREEISEIQARIGLLFAQTASEEQTKLLLGQQFETEKYRTKNIELQNLSEEVRARFAESGAIISNLQGLSAALGDTQLGITGSRSSVLSGVLGVNGIRGRKNSQKWLENLVFPN